MPLTLNRPYLLEAALGERLKRNCGLLPDPQVGLARHCTTSAGRSALYALWGEYARIAHDYRLPFLATTPTRRADRDRVQAAGLDSGLLRENAFFLRTLSRAWPGESYIGGMVGCYGEAYTGEGCLSEDNALFYHRWQISILAGCGVDFLYGALLPTLPEAKGIARAMGETGLPYILSLTLRPDGTLPDGTPLAQVIREIDDACAAAPPLGYMSNCVHPTLVRQALSAPCNQQPWVRERFVGIQGNASPQDLTALSQATDLLTSDPALFAQDTLALGELAALKIFGGCCGTDGRHLRAIARLLSDTQEDIPRRRDGIFTPGRQR